MNCNATWIETPPSPHPTPVPQILSDVCTGITPMIDVISLLKPKL